MTFTCRPWTPKIYLMNPADPGWQQFIFAQEQQAFDNYAFDGWHIDTLGRRNRLWDWNGESVDIPAALVDFTNKARAALNKRVVFNTVGGYAQDEIAAGAEVDFVYSEVWEQDGTSTYNDLVRIVERARARTDKAMVIPAYMNKRYGQQTSGGTRFFNEAAVRLTDATIFAAGAAHLELGDGEAMLSNEYFPFQPLVMSPTLKAAMRDYYDFSVAYENLLRDGVSVAQNKVGLDGQPTSVDGKQGTIWTLARSRSGYLVVHLINLKNNRSAAWRDQDAQTPAPDTLTDLPMKLYYSGSLRDGARLWYATPDAEEGKAHELSYSTGSDDGGTFLSFTVPRLEYWDMVWLEQ